MTMASIGSARRLAAMHSAPTVFHRGRSARLAGPPGNEHGCAHLHLAGLRVGPVKSKATYYLSGQKVVPVIAH
jgi:hypothetical protein